MGGSRFKSWWEQKFIYKKKGKKRREDWALLSQVSTLSLGRPLEEIEINEIICQMDNVKTLRFGDLTVFLSRILKYS